ncbi:MAG: hypothetical protein NUW02_01410 [Candidatus Campbellbacteria bacterium]|nr:hypothetical protein [Candidatus Campbellbacteria bacterium]
MNSLFKKNIAIIVLVVFSMLVLFSFGVVAHESGKQMTGDCPFSTAGATICPQDVLSVAIHHISAYNSFFNVPTSFGLTALIISVLSVIATLFVISPRLQLPSRLVFAHTVHTSPTVNSYTRKIIQWLSLFENSPSRT